MLRKGEAIRWLILALIVLWPLALWGANGDYQTPKTPIAQLEVQPARVDWLPQTAYEHLVLTVAGPDDFYLVQTFDNAHPPSLSIFDQGGSVLADGVYTYELRLLPSSSLATPRPSERQSTQWGSVYIQGGVFVLPQQPENQSPRQSLKTGKSMPKPSTAAQTINEDLVVVGRACIGPDCSAASASYDIMISDPLPALRFLDTSNCCTSHTDWLIRANTSGENLAVIDQTASTNPFTITGGAPDSSLFIASSGKIGLGTATPAVSLDVRANTSGAAVERLQNSSATGYSGTEYLDNAGNVDLFFGVDNGASTTRLNSGNSNPIVVLTNNTERMRITSGGNVGIGTSSPSNSLHVKRSDGTAQLLVEETSSAAAWRTMAEWTNNGGVQLNLTDRNAFGGTGVQWSVQNVNAQWRISDAGDSTLEMILDQAGNVTFAGTVTPGSSRTIKEQFSPVDPHDVLRRVVDLPITTWSYKATPGVRHLGPMSEDFFTAFSVGTDDKGISVTDSAGVALAAIQGLYLELAARDAQIATLRARVDELAGRLEHQGTTPQ